MCWQRDPHHGPDLADALMWHSCLGVQVGDAGASSTPAMYMSTIMRSSMEQ